MKYKCKSCRKKVEVIPCPNFSREIVHCAECNNILPKHSLFGFKYWFWSKWDNFKRRSENEEK